MSLWKPFALTPFCIIASVAIMLQKDTVSVALETPERLSPVEVSARLNRPEVTPGSAIRLAEFIPAAMDAKVGGISHTVLRIGRYDQKLRKLVNIDRSRYSLVNPNKAFDGLRGSLGFSHPYSFEIITPRHKGAEFTFRPNRLGIFLITAEWSLRGQEDNISSNPVILVVKPPVDVQGQVILKQEWFEAEGWQPTK